nr:Par o 1a=acidic allergen isoform {N-terminal} [Parietaria officinalis=pellitory, pollen, Peptide Partial, 25 aa] [Parietaria officinalis]
ATGKVVQDIMPPLLFVVQGKEKPSS